MPSFDPLKPPDDLDVESRRTWRTALRELQASSSWTDSTRELLILWCHALQDGRHARLRLARHGEHATEGSAGQSVVGVDVRLARDAARDALIYAEALGLSPRSRRAQGIEDASADPELAGLDGEIDRALRLVQGGRR